MLTIKGIYGREMFETWYAMSVLLEGGLDLTPGDHRPVRATRTSTRPSTTAASGRCGKVILDWTV